MLKVIDVLCCVVFFNIVPTKCILKQEDEKNNVSEPLLLTPFIEEGRLAEARNAAKVVLNGTEKISSYSGYLTVDKENNSNLFFWFFDSMNNANSDPVILWLQAGTLASSLNGLFVEHGPFRVNADNILKDRKYTWIQNHSVIYMDNQVGAGFSFTNEGYPTNVDQIAGHLYNAMLQFFQLFPHLQKNYFFIAGKFYGGKIIPALGHLISIMNPTAPLKINLQGMAIAEPFSDPVNQCMRGHYLYEHGVIDYMQLQTFLIAEYSISRLIDMERHGDASEVLQELDFVFADYTSLDNDYTKNILHGVEIVSILRYNYEKFVNLEMVRKAIHVGGTILEGGGPTDYLIDDHMKSVAPYVDFLLPKYRMLLYTGQLSSFINYESVNNFLQNLNYMKNREYSNMPIKNWVVDKQKAGYMIVSGNLTNIMVKNSGTTLPDMRPKFANDMILKFTRNEPN